MEMAPDHDEIWHDSGLIFRPTGIHAEMLRTEGHGARRVARVRDDFYKKIENAIDERGIVAAISKRESEILYRMKQEIDMPSPSATMLMNKKKEEKGKCGENGEKIPSWADSEKIETVQCADAVEMAFNASHRASAGDELETDSGGRVWIDSAAVVARDYGFGYDGPERAVDNNDEGEDRNRITKDMVCARLSPSSVSTITQYRVLGIFYVADRFFAIDNGCYHHGGPLVEGEIEDLNGRHLSGCSENIEDDKVAMYAVVCPWHHYRILISTGFSVYDGIDGCLKLKPGNKQRSHVIREREVFIYIFFFLPLFLSSFHALFLSFFFWEIFLLHFTRQHPLFACGTQDGTLWVALSTQIGAEDAQKNSVAEIENISSRFASESALQLKLEFEEGEEERGGDDVETEKEKENRRQKEIRMVGRRLRKAWSFESDHYAFTASRSQDKRGKGNDKGGSRRVRSGMVLSNKRHRKLKGYGGRSHNALESYGLFQRK